MGEIVQIKSRWQITLPKGARDALSVSEGEYLAAEIRGGSLILKPMRSGLISAKAHSAAALKNAAGAVSIGGNALEDAKKLYE